MATYTTLDQSGIQACLDLINLGELKSFSVPGHGIENTNYLLEVFSEKQNKLIPCVLTVYEGLSLSQVNIYTQCLSLWSQQLPVPQPLQDEPKMVPTIPDKFFLVATRLPGDHILIPSIENCAEIGRFLGEFHLLAQQTPLSFQGTRSIPWVLDYKPSVDACSKEDLQLFNACQNAIKALPELLDQCPTGWVHGDLFPDNALFQNNKLLGVIDFNNACTDSLLLDLCITMNAWSSLGPESSSPEKFKTILEAYTQVRPLTSAEAKAFDLTLLASAIRFWASRLDFVLETGGKPGKEPEEYRRLAQSYLATVSKL